MVTVYSPLTWGSHNKPPPDIPECGFLGERCPPPVRGKSSFDNEDSAIFQCNWIIWNVVEFALVLSCISLLPRDVMHSAVSAVLLCPSVRPSVSLVYCVEKAKLTIKIFNRLVAPSFYFPQEIRLWNFNEVTPNGVPNRGGVPKIWDFKLKFHFFLCTFVRYTFS